MIFNEFLNTFKRLANILHVKLNNKASRSNGSKLVNFFRGQNDFLERAR